MTYTIQISASPVHEFVFSFCFFMKPISEKMKKELSIGSNWYADREKQFPHIVEDEGYGSVQYEYATILAWLYSDDQGIEGFLRWFASLTAGDIYLLTEPYMSDRFSLPKDLSKLHERAARYLSEWYKEYFHSLLGYYESAIYEDVQKRIEEYEQAKDSESFLEAITGGLVMDSALGIKEIKLFPTIHLSPFFTSQVYGSLAIACYPINVWKSPEEQETDLLVNMGKALADERRISILQFLSNGKKSFGDIAAMLGTTKGTIHHHLLFLNAAKMLRLYETGDRNSYGYYETRPLLADKMQELLQKKTRN
ncbi:winged helix-turn-helix domain-containing protein [Brevibacillus ginsengisoli]|uniref:winged helix-turn-helix domain-containing protein n=1 Tax=Brevibacillus ginsengisoli TaxID=363854 RepID=UPI003CF89B1D